MHLEPEVQKNLQSQEVLQIKMRAHQKEVATFTKCLLQECVNQAPCKTLDNRKCRRIKE